MAHYAFLDANNIVTEVIVGVDENELIEGISPENWYGQNKNQKCVRTSYNGKIRRRYAGVGYFYDEINDVFITQKPYDSWLLDSNFDWVAPKPCPIDGKKYEWDENSKDWVNA